MQAAIFILGFIVWAIAAYGFARMVMGWVGVARLAPQGQKIAAMFNLGTGNFSAAAAISGPGSAGAIDSFKHGRKVFLLAFFPFMLLVLVNILTGNAA
ncbi:hypothetical protein SAMN02983003_0904 [Devosia enhydra]|uniref:Uncharacterized protein n=1 Tax=Devosia enhydra TaxID=665118 RepID=A0A1K2HV41_9HYPH|nr:hypothetical protein [Devosia enhydra]SFZ82144.1 hypothetical protein SAMN02983003_0904 [Devosia enhydra]